MLFYSLNNLFCSRMLRPANDAKLAVTTAWNLPQIRDQIIITIIVIIIIIIIIMIIMNIRRKNLKTFLL